MPRARTIAIFALASAGVVAAQQPQEPTFRTGTNIVSVYATVLDPIGRLVPELTKDDFTVFDNGKPQRIDVFSNAIRPITIVVMLDRSGSMVRNFDLERRAAVQFVVNLLPADRARLGSFSNRVEIDPDHFTSDRDELIRILYEELQESGPTPLWNATNAAMTALAHQEDRRVVLMLTDGYDNPSRPETAVRFEEVRARSEAEEIMVYGIGIAGNCGVATAQLPAFMIQRRGGFGAPGGRGFPMGRGYCGEAKPDPHLHELSTASGGGYFELSINDDLGSTFARIANELHHQYLLGFAATALDGKVHQLEVRLREPDFVVRARRSYVAAPGPGR